MPESRRPAAASSILAFDFGLRRIGVAVGQSITASASPLTTLDNRNDGSELRQIGALVREWRPDRLVVGLPLQADGTLGEIGQAAEAFAVLLEDFGLPVERIDERHSSSEAEQALKNARQAGRRGRIRKEQIDAAAAVFIAERYLLGLEVRKMPAR